MQENECFHGEAHNWSGACCVLGARIQRLCVVRVFRVGRAVFPMSTSASNCPLEVSYFSTECPTIVACYFIFILKVIFTEMAKLPVWQQPESSFRYAQKPRFGVVESSLHPISPAPVLILSSFLRLFYNCLFPSALPITYSLTILFFFGAVA